MLASFFKHCVFGLPNSSESVKHAYWDYIQVRRAWRWSTFIMHELCGVGIGNYDSFNWKQTLFGERIPNKYDKKLCNLAPPPGYHPLDHLDQM